MKSFRTKKGTAILMTAALMLLPITSYGFEMIGEYYEMSCHEAGAFIFDGTTVTAGTTGQLVLSRLESSWASESIITTTDMNVIFAKIVPGGDGLNVLQYTAKNPGSAKLVVVVPSGAAINMGTFYVVAGDSAGTTTSGWILQDGQWKYQKGDGNYITGEWFVDNGKWYYFGEDGIMYADQWARYGEWWCYLGSDGAMLTNTTTPDGYWVNDSGVWVE